MCFGECFTLLQSSCDRYQLCRCRCRAGVCTTPARRRHELLPLLPERRVKPAPSPAMTTPDNSGTAYGRGPTSPARRCHARRPQPSHGWQSHAEGRAGQPWRAGQPGTNHQSIAVDGPLACRQSTPSGPEINPWQSQSQPRPVVSWAGLAGRPSWLVVPEITIAHT